MILVQRYVASIKNYLPGHLREDVGEEIQTLLEDKIEELESETVEPLDDASIMEIVKQHGHPMKVAAAYQRQQVLIGPELFPFYKQTLKYLALGLVIFNIVTGLISILAHDSFFNGLSLGGFGNFFDSFLYLAAWTTLIFYGIDRWSDNKDFFVNWNPNTLPELEKSWVPIPLFSTIIESIFTLIFCAAINGWLAIPFTVGYQKLVFGFSQEALDMVPILNVLLVYSLALNAINLVQPFWSRWKLLAHVVCDGLFCWLAFTLAMIKPLIIMPPEVAEAFSKVHFSVWPGFIILILILLWDIFKNLRRFLQFNQAQS